MEKVKSLLNFIKSKSKKMEGEKADKKANIKFTIIAIVLIAIFCIALTPKTLQNDTFYTIKIGEHISKYGIDMQDPFSWHEGLAYTYPHWLYDFLTYIIYSLGEMRGIYIITCGLSVILGITLYFTNERIAKNKVFSFIITIGALYLIRPYIAARAQLVTFILFVLEILFIEEFLETKKKRYALGLIIIPILLANLHVAVFPFYFILYLPYIGAYIISCISEIIIYKKIKIGNLRIRIKKSKNEPKREQLQKKLKIIEESVSKRKIKRAKELKNPYKIQMEKNKNVKWLILIVIICIFTGLLTPLGTTPYTYLQKTMQGNTTESINEHLPMTLSNETEVMCTIIIFLAILIFTKTKIKLSDLFMLGGLCYLMLLTKRQMTMFVLICSVILNKSLVQMLHEYTKIEFKQLTRITTSILGIIIISGVMLGFSYHMAKDKFDDEYIDSNDYPVAACDYIINNIDLGKTRFYNEYNYGSYMLYRGIPVFIDSRADLYAPEFSGKEDDIFSDFIDTSSIGVFYEDTMEKYNITHVITYKNSKMNMIIEKTNAKNYKELYSDDNFIIYERTSQEK